MAHATQQRSDALGMLCRTRRPSSRSCTCTSCPRGRFRGPSTQASRRTAGSAFISESEHADRGERKWSQRAAATCLVVREGRRAVGPGLAVERDGHTHRHVHLPLRSERALLAAAASGTDRAR
jgi:hypothetical protein